MGAAVGCVYGFGLEAEMAIGVNLLDMLVSIGGGRTFLK